MPDFVFVLDIRTLIGLTLLSLVILLMLFVLGISAVANFLKWRKTGYCNHNWELESTASFGTVHKYKCHKCNKVSMLDSNYVNRSRSKRG